MVAQGLGLDVDRVAVGGNVHMKRMAIADESVFGPAWATPLGIALTAAKSKWGDGFSVIVNGKKLHLMNHWDSSVLGVLQLSGVPYGSMMGRAGQPLHYKLEGEPRTLRGGLPEPAQIQCNGTTVPLSHPVNPGDALTFVAAVQGEDAVLTLAQAVGTTDVSGWLVDGIPRPADWLVQTGDDIRHAPTHEPQQDRQEATPEGIPAQWRTQVDWSEPKVRVTTPPGASDPEPFPQVAPPSPTERPAPPGPPHRPEGRGRPPQFRPGQSRGRNPSPLPRPRNRPHKPVQLPPKRGFKSYSTENL